VRVSAPLVGAAARSSSGLASVFLLGVGVQGLEFRVQGLGFRV